jgi:hypothetical protein
MGLGCSLALHSHRSVQIFCLIGNVAGHGPRLPRGALVAMLVILILDAVVSFVDMYSFWFGA